MFIGNGSYGFLFSMAPTSLLCFCWTHFWWCGVVSVTTLMEEGQRIEEKDKERAMWNNEGDSTFFSTKKDISSLTFWF